MDSEPQKGAAPPPICRPDGHKRHSTRPRRKVGRLPSLPSVTFGKCVGSGHFSHVYEGTFQGRPAAIKVIERGNNRSVENEVSLLLRLRNQPHVVQLWMVFVESNTFMVFELSRGISARRFFAGVTIPRLRFVLRAVLEALREAHAAGVVHRDVKLENVLVSGDWQSVTLIDWGCGALVTNDLSTTAGSRFSRSIEMLLGYRGYRTACDIWAVGALICAVLCNGDVPWAAATVDSSIIKLAGFVGRETVIDLAQQYGAQLPKNTLKAIQTARSRKWEDSFSFRMKKMRDPALVDLMVKLMAPRIEDRPTADRALQHPFFSQE
jgi:serine/threonine protein kinase